MRNLIAIAVVAITIPFLNVGSASAEGLNGEQIKKLLIGNTINFSRENLNRVRISHWAYYKDATTRIVQQKREKKASEKWRDFNTEWSVTKDGTYCHLSINDNENCRKNVRVSGNKITMEGIGGKRDLKYELLKGNPKNLKVEEQSY